MARTAWLAPAGALYAHLARRRRERYAASPGLQRRLERPVVSIGNLAIGGTGKTPVVAHLAAALVDAGERPAVLTRGYGRRVVEDGVVVARTPERLTADVDRSGDEPAMLARRLDGAAVVVCADRHLAGRYAEARLGCTVHLLDDGFQHVRLARDLDLVLVTEDDLTAGAVLPSGRLREGLDALTRADALIVPDVPLARAEQLAAHVGVPCAFASRRRLGVARRVDDAEKSVEKECAVLACAAVARPERFFEDLRADGWHVVGDLRWRDHHRFTAADVAAVDRARRAAGASLVITTEKDVVRWLSWRPLPFPLAWVPLMLDVEPADALVPWVVERIRTIRSASGAAEHGASSPGCW
ncbi:MAG: tetraacyldisaccharide 4'-kinase [Vicinamibacterales bacterium]|mgnify:CR=1 FL=1